MIIRTSQERNLLACCCDMPECGPPRLLIPEPQCCISAPFAAGDFSEMGLPEGFDELCFQYIEYESNSSQVIDNTSTIGGYPSNFDSLILERSYAKHEVPFEGIEPDACDLKRVIRTYDYDRTETNFIIPGEEIPSYNNTSTYVESTTGTTGDCAGTWNSHDFGADAGGSYDDTDSGVSASCADLFEIMIGDDWTYTSGAGGGHRFEKTTITGDIESTGEDTLTRTIILTEWDNRKYQYCVPDDYSTTEAPRSVWDMQWDVGFFTGIWLDWFNGGMIGTEPAPLPHLHEENDWIWGGDMAEPCSPIYDLPRPSDHGFEDDPENDIIWEALRLNVLVKCYRSTRVGVKPTAHGMQYEWPVIP